MTLYKRLQNTSFVHLHFKTNNRDMRQDS